MIETVPNNRVYEADFRGRTPLYQAASHPGMVLRRPKSEIEMSDLAIAERDKRFAELLLDLEESYGIRSPGMTLAKVPYTYGSPEVFIGGQWVEGKNLSDQSSEIPPPAVRQAIEAIISYYRQATLKGGAYLSDIRPSNIIYGHTAKDTADHLYFVDIEPLWAENEARHPLHVSHMDRILPELWLLIEEGLRNGQDWQDLKAAYIDLVALQR